MSTFKRVSTTIIVDDSRIFEVPAWVTLESFCGSLNIGVPTEKIVEVLPIHGDCSLCNKSGPLSKGGGYRIPISPNSSVGFVASQGAGRWVAGHFGFKERERDILFLYQDSVSAKPMRDAATKFVVATLPETCPHGVPDPVLCKQVFTWTYCVSFL